MQGGISRRNLLKYGAGTLAGAALGGLGWVMATHRFRSRYRVRAAQTLMKTYVSVTVIDEDRDQGRAAVAAAFRRMRAAAAVLTRFAPQSPVAVLNRTGRVARIPADLYTVLDRARHYWDLSGGSFDVTVLPVLEYYYSLPRPFARERLDRAEVERRKALIGFRGLAFDRGGARLVRAGMAVTLDGIAKGHVVDEGMRALRAAGVRNAVIDAGGDVRTMSADDPQHYWTIGIADPQDPRRLCATAQLRNGALATSGNYEIYFTSDRRLFHIINPRTGYSPDRYSSVTVFAEHAMDSDAGGVTLFSLDRAQSCEVLRRGGLEAFLVSWDGGTRWRSRGFPLARGEARLLC